MPLTAEEQSLAEETFATFDKNKDGTISADELQRMLRRMGQKLSNDEIDAMIKEVDADNNGSVGKAEFFKIVERASGSGEADLKDTFAAYDTDGSGYLTAAEVRKVVVAITRDKRISLETINELIEKSDKDGDGKINYSEFIKLFEVAKA